MVDLSRKNTKISCKKNMKEISPVKRSSTAVSRKKLLHE